MLASGDIIIKRQAETITALAEQNTAFRQALNTAAPLINKPEPWYENKYLWFILGAGVGIAVTK